MALPWYGQKELTWDEIDPKQDPETLNPQEELSHLSGTRHPEGSNVAQFYINPRGNETHARNIMR